jgi:hypothetical protein
MLVVSLRGAEWEIVDEVDENTRVVRQVNKLSWPLSNRDMALASGRVESDGTHALVFRSVEHDKVRTTTIISPSSSSSSPST